MRLTVTAKATKNVVRAGEWMALYGEVLRDGIPYRTAEIWLIINGRYVKCLPQTCWDDRYFINCRFGSGVYRIFVEGYKIPVNIIEEHDGRQVLKKKEYKIRSDLIRVVAVPKLINNYRMLPTTYQVENWRRITQEEAVELGKKTVPYILDKYRDTRSISLVGGIVKRGWSRRDIDFVVDSPLLREQQGLQALGLQGDIESIISYPVTVFTAREAPKPSWRYPHNLSSLFDEGEILLYEG